MVARPYGKALASELEALKGTAQTSALEPVGELLPEQLCGRGKEGRRCGYFAKKRMSPNARLRKISAITTSPAMNQRSPCRSTIDGSPRGSAMQTNGDLLGDRPMALIAGLRQLYPSIK